MANLGDPIDRGDESLPALALLRKHLPSALVIR
jgi:hypothetical protein